MKPYKIFCYLAVLTGLSFGCKKDNYPAPTATISGKLIDVNTGGIVFGAAGNNASFGNLKLYQLGYSSIAPQPNTNNAFKADGTYSSLLIFDGKYKVVPDGPYFYQDTLIVDVKGNTNVDLKVVPYINVSCAVNTVTANSISVSVRAIRNTYADVIKAQPIINVVTLLGTTPVVDYNTYLKVNGNGTDYRSQVNTTAFTNEVIGATVYTYTFANLKPNTTYYIRGGAKVSTGNPNSYYNYSSVIEVTTKQ
jgi:hypothetical protein